MKRNFKKDVLAIKYHDFKSSITVFFVALPLCLGISLASNAPMSAGLIGGIVGGLVISAFSNSQLSVSGPAAGLAAICAASILELGSFQLFSLSLILAGVFQSLFGIFRLGSFTHFIPTAVIKGMLAAIGILLFSKQFPLLFGYNKPDFWANQLFSIITLNHAFSHIKDLFSSSSLGVSIISLLSAIVLIGWNIQKIPILKVIPGAMMTVLIGIFLSLLMTKTQLFHLQADHFVNLPDKIFNDIPNITSIFNSISLPQFSQLWKTGIIIAIIASLETLLSIVAIDKLDPYNRITSQNRELIAQGIGNFTSGFLGGLPLTSVIVRSSANVEAGAKTKFSAFFHGLWILIAVLFATKYINMIPLAVLAVLLCRTGYNLAKPSMFKLTYSQGREQFIPFIVSIISILLTDLLIGVLIGIACSIYFIIQKNYQLGFTSRIEQKGQLITHFISFSDPVSFLVKRRLIEYLDAIQPYSIVHISGQHVKNIDIDILEIIQDYKSKAAQRHIQLSLSDIQEIKTIELH